MWQGLMFGLVGGLIIGLSTVVLLLTSGRIAGISGIVAGLFQSEAAERSWRALFLIGMVVGELVMYLIRPEIVGVPLERSTVVVVTVCVLVGCRTGLGFGCAGGTGDNCLRRLYGRRHGGV